MQYLVLYPIVEYLLLDRILDPVRTVV